MEEFGPGDLVQLKSGGPLMTVEELGKDPITQDDVVWCTWFEKVRNRQERQKDAFKPITIAKREVPATSFISMRVQRG